MFTTLIYRLTAAICILAMLSGCSLTPRLSEREKELLVTSPSPYTKATAYSDALEQLGGMLEAYGYPSEPYVIQGRHIINKTACKNLPLDITDIIKTAVNKIDGNVLYAKFDPDYIIGEVQTGNPNIQRKLPVVVLDGAITECDENLDSGGFGVDVDLMFGEGSSETDIGAGGNKDSGYSRIALDLHLMDYGNQTLIPKKQSSMAVDVWSLNKSYSFGFQVDGSGLGIDGQRKVTQGRHDAIRILVELSVLQLVGRLFEVPYWRCVQGAEADSATLKMIKKNFNAASREVQVSTTQALLSRHGYRVKVTGQMNEETRRAMDRYVVTTNQEMEPVIGANLYTHLYVTMPLKISAPTPTDFSKNKLSDDAAPPKPDSLPVSLHTALIYTPDWSSSPLRFRRGHGLKSGDRYKFLMMSEQNCYLYIFQADSTGNMSMLFPMDTFGGVRVNNINPIRGNTAYSFPGPETFFVLDQHQGTEKFYVIASSRADARLENLGMRLNSRQGTDDLERSELSNELLTYLGRKELVKTTMPGVTFNLDGSNGQALNFEADMLKADDNKVYVFEFEHQ